MVKLKPILAIGLAFSLAVPIPAYAETETITSNTSQEVKVTADIPSSWTVTIPKAITLSSEKSGSGTYTGSIPVTVTGDIGVKEVITVDTNRSLQLSDSTGANTGSIKANITKAKTEFNFNDLTGNQTAETAHNVSADLVPGDWSGTAPFYINITNQVITVTAKDSQGNNLNASANEITGQQKDDLLNSLLNSNMISSTASVDALIEVKSDQFDGIASTELEVSSLYKDGTKVAILHFDEIEQEWEYIGTDTVENGLISGDFSSYSPVVFVKVNDGTYENIEYIPFTLTSSNYTQAGITRSGDVVIPRTFEYNSVKYKVVALGNEVFYNCTGLTSLVIPDTVTSMGFYIARNCPNLTSVAVLGATNIGSCSFYDCTSLKDVTLAEGVRYIESSAFFNCKSLTSIELPSSITSIGADAFYFCEKLQSIAIPKGITRIEARTFRWCSKLSSIKVPDTVTYIGEYAFNYCSSLKNLYYSGTQTQWNSISKGSYWKESCPLTVVYNYTE